MAPQNVKFITSKSTQHQELKVDGAIGGPSPSGRGITMSVYTERFPIPKESTFTLDETGLLSGELLDERVELQGIVRTVQATLHMDKPQAIAIRDWLTVQIDKIVDEKEKKS